MFRELAALKFPAMHTLIGIPDPKRNLTTQWVVLTEEIEGWDVVYKADLIVALEQFELKALHKAHSSNRRLKASSGGQPVYLPHQFAKQEILDLVQRYVELGQWSAEKAEAMSQVEIPEQSEFAVVQHKHGYMAFWLAEPLEASGIEEVKRFAETFAFAYERFLDLQSKERRALEAEVEAALERVRAHALAMQATEDLPSVSAALFRELNTLAFPVLNTVICVVDEAQDLVQQWTVLPKGLEHLAHQLGHLYEAQEPPIILERFARSKPHRAIARWGTCYRTWKKTGEVAHSLRWTRRQLDAVHGRMVTLGIWTEEIAETHRQFLGDNAIFDQSLVFYKHGYLFLNQSAVPWTLSSWTR